MPARTPCLPQKSEITKTNRKNIRQRRDRRKRSLLRKSYEYGVLCVADVFIGIRDRESGQIFTFCTDQPNPWSHFESQLVWPYKWFFTSTQANSRRAHIILFQFTRLRKTLKVERRNDNFVHKSGYMPSMSAWSSNSIAVRFPSRVTSHDSVNELTEVLVLCFSTRPDLTLSLALLV